MATRLLPDRSLPPYSYVSGLFPHPLTSPLGHSYGHEVEPEAIDEAKWFECETYLWAIDLFNCGYYWEAHEQWEGLWKSADRQETKADFLRALIKLAAAGVKAREQRPQGVRRHAEKAAGIWQAVGAEIQRRQTGQRRGDETTYLGMNLETLIDRARWVVDEAEELAGQEQDTQAAAVVVFPFALEIIPRGDNTT